MSISHSLANALTGLTASARMAEVVSSNLSNVMTDGYGRRVVDLSAQQLGGRGAGVQIDGISRIIDRGVLAERRLAEAGMGFTSTHSGALSRLEAAIGMIDDAASLAGRVAALEAALTSSAVNPSNTLQLEEVLYRLQDLARAFNDDQSAISDLREEADAGIARDVDTLNTALARIETLNTDIVAARSRGADASGLMDQRQAVIDTIATIVPVREVERGNGRIALMTTGGELLIDGQAPEFGFVRSATITPGMTLSGGALSGLTRNGVPFDYANNLDGGTLGAAFRIRDETMPAAQAQLDSMARDLIERFQDPAFDPTIGGGLAGLFTDSGAAFDPADELGVAGRIAVNSAVDPENGGDLTRLRDGVGAVSPGPVGDAGQLNSWIAALTDPRILSIGGSALGVAEHAAEFATSIAMDRVRSEDSAAFAAGRYNAAREAELASGVDTDQELQLLLQIEQAYAANAKVIETADAMIRRLMEL
ncbi:flagellar hook-associated protein FlgK [Ponticoccus sp. SC2-23]|uniref:flagellar hook-associated protein FlgK n=1 Tax=Alexandriicola marinus TaxID=2081710 RepID=UPI000FDC1CEC|nr:flagellar hook-associated protein FlgK [Alexandriicola marinus]MBM1220531.1 flagellar hook-associated protein FlgK [Ponticoccus sp. SC6-9]MBM1225217.1 flagellar hook-associated protein FlgK [Ponticoccus sp. SC6-15]MBM1228731.1 flagellar hook-associated protein FlgK [Ponticoccus sp. SC6-38]MBM1233632.1 flagellar hook-associated protein FlgK [Ponticoccus sp. SC6-45]MBM1239232.1 flagellar hook-associated protein FlgK [Ponticoccus sp. SC6-49]MBM1243014.1 flagellar hook-associated protein FlgK 